MRKQQYLWQLGVLAVGFIGFAVHASSSRAEGTRQPAAAPRAALEPIARELREGDPLVDRVSEQGQRARGLYFSAPVQKRLGARGIIAKLRRSGMDAAVLDLKDGEGRVSYDTKIPALQPQKRRYVEDVPAFIAELKAAGIYTIGRVVCFSDPFLPRNEPDRAIMDNRPNKQGLLWASWGKRNTWLDPYNTKNHDLIVELAKEAEALGIDEIQFDYIRWPVDSTVRFATFPSQVETPRRFVLLGMLKRIDEAVRIPIGADVFGLTALRVGDPAGLGQSLEDCAAHLDVFSPMLYLNGMQSLAPKGGTQRAQRLIIGAVKTLRNRIGDKPVIRPFLQGFEAGADYYNPEFIAEQIVGAKVGGADGFLFWHPGSNFGMVQAAMVGPARGLSPFAIDGRMEARRAIYGKATVGKDATAAAEPAPPVEPAEAARPIKPAKRAPAAATPGAAPQGVRDAAGR